LKEDFPLEHQGQTGDVPELHWPSEDTEAHHHRRRRRIGSNEGSEVATTIGVPELDPLAAIGMVTEVYATLASGKEGTVYCCRTPPSTRRRFVAAKIYREHAASDHRWSNTYFEGRERVLKPQVLRAIRARTAFGREAAAELWVTAEFDALSILRRAGVSTPEPIDRIGRAILMEYIGNGAGPAPHLDEIEIDQGRARRLFDDVLENVVRMLRSHLVHGDLSPYNILVWEEEARFIDVPQAVDVRFNRSAFELLRRDLANICSFFERHGVNARADALATDLWQRYQDAKL
jgi:RIO kinase 1